MPLADVISGLKICAACKIPSSISDFHRNKSMADGLTPYCKKCNKIKSAEYVLKNPDKVRLQRKESYCKHIEKRREKSSQYYHRNKEAHYAKGVAYRKQNREKCHAADIAYHRRRRYGLSPDETETLVQRQKNKCIGCLKDFDTIRMCIDHCHITGKVRGLLCHKCNSGIGLMEDNPIILGRLLAYLESHTATIT